MAKIDYNVSAKLKKLKKLAQSHFLAGNTVEVVQQLTGLSKDLLNEWHDEFVISVVRSGPSRRAFLRELLLKNAPSMILTLAALAKQKGDEKLQYSAASGILAFATRFMNEDVKLLSQEQKITDTVDEDPMMRRGLFDIAEPDVSGSKKAEEGLFDQAARGNMELSDETVAELLAAADRLEKNRLIPSEEDEPEEVELFDGIED